MNMMNRLLLAAVATGLLTGCITSKEIIVGRDENGNEIVRKADDIDYEWNGNISKAHPYQPEDRRIVYKESGASCIIQSEPDKEADG